MTKPTRAPVAKTAAVLPVRQVRVGDSRVFITASQARHMEATGAYELNATGTVIRETQGGRPTTARGYDSGRLEHLEQLRRVPVANWRELIRERRHNTSKDNPRRDQHVRDAHQAIKARNRSRADQARMDAMAKAREVVTHGS